MVVLTSTPAIVENVVVLVVNEATIVEYVVISALTLKLIPGPVVAVIIRWEYSRKIGENKSGANATLDSRFCGKSANVIC